MFSVIFPGQGSQIVGMGKEFYEKFDLVKNLFKEADAALNFSISKLILEGPKEELDLTINTQPAIFLISYSIFKVIKHEFNINLNNAKYYAGHSLGEYTALSCAGYLDFQNTINYLLKRDSWISFSQTFHIQAVMSPLANSSTPSREAWAPPTPTTSTTTPGGSCSWRQSCKDSMQIWDAWLHSSGITRWDQS